MKKATKVWFMFTLAGLVGILGTIGYLMASNQLMSREAQKVIQVKESFHAIELGLVHGEATVLADNQNQGVEVFVKAWLPDEINVDEVLKCTVENDTLTIKETPFPSNFLGYFPQPYEMRLTVYVPDDVYTQYVGGKL